MLPQTEASLQHILHHRDAYLKDRSERQLASRPMVVGVSGCQGSGKTTLCDTLTHLLSSEPYNLNVVNFSLDDFYLTREDQARLTAANPENELFKYRGQPGSHDLDLARTTMENLLRANAEVERDPSTAVSVLIPSYDKSLYGGLGDRRDKSQWLVTYAPYDIILFEGWSQGFKPLLPAQLKRVYEQACYAKEKNNYSSCLPKHPLAHLEQMNKNLERYESELYPYFDIFIHLSPADPHQVYAWRLQQEHHMKATRGVQGLSDEQVRAFVDTYMPAYELYLPRLDRVGFFGQGLHGEPLKAYEGPKRADGGYGGPQRHLRLVLDPDRRVIRSQRMKEIVLEEPAGGSDSSSKGWIISSRPVPRFLLSCTVIGLLGFAGYSWRRRLLDTVLRISRIKP